MRQAYLKKKSRETLRELTQIHRSDGFDLSISDHDSLINTTNELQAHIRNYGNKNNNATATNTTNVS